MSLIVVGLNHRTVPVELLERMTVPDGAAREGAARPRRARAPARGRRALDVQPHRGLRALHALPRRGRRRRATSSPRYSGADPDEFADHLYTYYDDAAVAHLFSVAAGLDSMIVGESEILGQVRDAWQAAVREGRPRRSCCRGCSGTRSSRASGCAPRPGSAAIRCRSRRPRSRSRPSTSATLDGATRARDRRRPDGSRARVDACGRAASADVVDREPHARRAPKRSPRSIGGEAIPLTDDRRHARRRRRAAHVDRVDARCSIERATVEMVMACRDGRPLLVVDVALPRDVDPGVRDVNDVTLLDLDDLKDYAQRSAERRRGEIGKVREILAAEIERYRAERAAREVAPLVDVAARARRRRARAASSSASAPSSRSLDPDSARARRGAHAGHRQQAAARADRAREGRGRHAAWRLLRRRARARCSTCPSAD